MNYRLTLSYIGAPLNIAYEFMFPFFYFLLSAVKGDPVHQIISSVILYFQMQEM
jgi:hypothetical protein